MSDAILEKFIKKLSEILPTAEFLILSGSVPSGVEDNIYKRLIGIAASYDVKVILDADGEKLKKGTEALPYVIKPNLFEFEQLSGKKFDNVEKIILAAEDYIKQGVGMVVISMGANGAVFVSQEGKCVAKALAVDCKSTVGAGDSMVAAIAYGLQSGFTLEKIARFASAAGSITASKDGSDVCTMNEVLNSFDFIEIIK